MAISLYDLSVGTYQQILGAVAGFLEKGRSHCEANGIDLAAVVDTRLHPDMFPFRFQIVSVAHHSLGALKGIQSGVFAPPNPPTEYDYAGLQNLVKEASAGVEKFDRASVNGFEGKDVVFKIGDRSMPFTAENFVLSFSLPNFYFHASTAYDILRMKGVPIGKRDFMGRPRMKS
jgi:hypothetical protein